jgi:Tfp pilus assembly major pilin PilA
METFTFSFLQSQVVLTDSDQRELLPPLADRLRQSSLERAKTNMPSSMKAPRANKEAVLFKVQEPYVASLLPVGHGAETTAPNDKQRNGISNSICRAPLTLSKVRTSGTITTPTVNLKDHQSLDAVHLAGCKRMIGVRCCSWRRLLDRGERWRGLCFSLRPAKVMGRRMMRTCRHINHCPA